MSLTSIRGGEGASLASVPYESRAGFWPAAGRLLPLACVLILGCGGTMTPLGWQGGNRQWFDAEVLSGVGDGGRPVATLTVSIPYRNLVFFVRNNAFEAGYTIHVVQKQGDVALRLDEWKGKVHVDSYAQTRQALVMRRTVQLDLAATPEAEKAPLRLEVDVSIEGTRRNSALLLEVSPTRLDEGGLTLGELALYRRRFPFEAPLPERMEVMAHAVPDPAIFQRQMNRNFDQATAEPWLLVRIFDLRPVEAVSDHHLDIAVFDAGSSEPRFRRQVTVERQGVETAVLMELPADAFAFGRNRITVEMTDAKRREITLENLGLDLRDEKSWEANLAQIEVLADDQEMKQLRAAAPEDRISVWNEFWKRRDPDPSTSENERMVEHYRRVIYARLHLQDGYEEGTLSDRGKVYVLRGKPDSVETTSQGIDSFIAYEVWRYFDQSVAYYFQDLDGLGHYRLVWREST